MLAQINRDGEPMRDTSFHFEILPKRLRLHMPRTDLLVAGAARGERADSSKGSGQKIGWNPFSIFRSVGQSPAHACPVEQPQLSVLHHPRRSGISHAHQPDDMFIPRTWQQVWFYNCP